LDAPPLPVVDPCWPMSRERTPRCAVDEGDAAEH
jgi:hypothetical protein